MFFTPPQVPDAPITATLIDPKRLVRLANPTNKHARSWSLRGFYSLNGARMSCARSAADRAVGGRESSSLCPEEPLARVRPAQSRGTVRRSTPQHPTTHPRLHPLGDEAHVWDVSISAPVASAEGGKNVVRGASGGEDGSLRVWDAHQGSAACDCGHRRHTSAPFSRTKTRVNTHAFTRQSRKGPAGTQGRC